MKNNKQIRLMGNTYQNGKELQITRRKTDEMKENIVRSTIVFGNFKIPLLVFISNQKVWDTTKK